MQRHWAKLCKSVLFNAMSTLQNLNVDRVVAAIIADDQDAEAIRDDLVLSLQQAKAGQFARVTELRAVVDEPVRHSPKNP